MSNPSDARDPSRRSPLDAASLDGHTVEQLSDYLDRGRLPRDAAIESSPAAQNALAALSRLRLIAPRILEAEAEARDVSDDTWIQRILEQIAVQAHAGRNIPIHHHSPDANLSVSEGAVRALVRETGDGIDGLIVERTRLSGDIEAVGASATVEVQVSFFSGVDQNQLIDTLRDGVVRALATHTELAVQEVVVTVHETELSEREGDRHE